MLKTLYARFLLWLIRPALERRIAERKRERDQVINALAADIADGGSVSQALEQTYDLQRIGR